MFGIEEKNKPMEKEKPPPAPAEAEYHDRNSFQERWKEFCSTTSVSAISRSYQTGSWFRRLCWMFLLFVGLAFMIQQITYVVKNYLDYPSEVNINLKFSAMTEFPAVTVCNLNPVKQSMIMAEDSPLSNFYKDESYTGGDDDPIFSAIQGQGTPPPDSAPGSAPTPAPGSAPTPAPAPMPSGRKKRSTDTDSEDYNRWESLRDDPDLSGSFYGSKDSTYSTAVSLEKAIMTMSLDELEHAAHPLDEFLLDCKWMGYPCGPDNFTTIINYKYGLCYTMNSGLNSSTALTTSNSGPQYGLNLELFVDQDEYLRDLSPEAGVKIIVHARDQMPFPEDMGVSAAVGMKTSIAMKKVEILRLSEPWGNCQEENQDVVNLYPHYSYSTITCQKSCWQQILFDTCGCSDHTVHLLNEGDEFCDDEDEDTAICIDDAKEAYRNADSGCNSLCHLPCNETLDELVVSTASWPSLNYEPILQNKLTRTSSQVEGYINNLRDHLVKVEIYYESLNYESIQESASYSLESLVSDIGGQLGLWLGLSIIAIAEFGEFLFVLCKVLFVRSRGPSSRVNSEQT